MKVKFLGTFHSVQHNGAKKKENYMGHDISRLYIVQYPFILKSDFVILISRLPVQIFFFTPDGAMDLTFQMKYNTNKICI